MDNLNLQWSRFESIHEAFSFNEKIQKLHSSLQTRFPFIHRIAIALYDEQMATMKSFVQSSATNPIQFYECRIEVATSLLQIKQEKKARLVNNLAIFDSGKNEHTKNIRAGGYQSSYTVPLVEGHAFLGAVFFNSFHPYIFTEESLTELNVFSELITSLILNKLRATKMLIGAFISALDLVSYKDPETGNHLSRMARYSRLIGRHLAGQGLYNLTDEIIEHLFLFAPLHDIGKIGIPDKILLKEAKLNAPEWEIMQTHSQKGRDIIHTISTNLGIHCFEHMNLLENITACHHETLDGKGYPNGLSKDDIPIESQIVAVADIFDALTSKRSYKQAWSNEDAFQKLEELAGDKLNPDCVEALVSNRSSIDEIQQRFVD